MVTQAAMVGFEGGSLSINYNHTNFFYKVTRVNEICYYVGIMHSHVVF